MTDTEAESIYREHAELNVRYERISKYIGSDPYNALKPYGRSLIREQKRIMERYLVILESRISFHAKEHRR